MFDVVEKSLGLLIIRSNFTPFSKKFIIYENTVIISCSFINLHIFLFTNKIEKGLELGSALKINPIYFDFNKDNIRPDAALELDKIVTILKKHPEIYIELGSHTDCRGSEEFNEDLSYRRAESSRNYIIERGIEEKRIYGKGYGESKLVNHCKCDLKDENKYPETLHQKNRRTEFVIVKILKD